MRLLHHLCFLFVLLAVASSATSTSSDTTTTSTSTSTSTSTFSNDNNNSSTSDAVIVVTTLRDGHTIPKIGLGVSLTEEATYEAVQTALDVGYRLVDTAAEENTYGNEDQVARAISDWKKARAARAKAKAKANNTVTDKNNRVYVTTKLWDDHHGFFETLTAFDYSWEALNLSLTTVAGAGEQSSVDMYLMHSPFGGRLVETWDAMVYLQSKNYIKSIGVSNFGLQHLAILEQHDRPLPTINQIELHPLNYQQRLPLIEWCLEHNIQIQAYGSLFHGYEQYLHDPNLLQLQKEHYPNKTVAQILLRWAVQHNFLVIPKSAKAERIQENIQLFDFELTSEDMERLDHWGDHISSLTDPAAALPQVNLYKKDWNWNPVDEAAPHLGAIHFWPNYKGVDEVYFAPSNSDSEDDDDDEEEEEEGDDDDDELGEDEEEAEEEEL